MKKALSIILAVAMLIALIVGCGGSGSKEPSSEPASSEPASSEDASSDEGGDPAAGKKIAVCMGSINHPVHRIVQMGFLTRGEELGMDPEVCGLDEPNSMQELLAEWESSVDNGCEGILAWCGDNTYYDWLKTIKDKGAYVVVPHFPHNYEEAKDLIDKNVSCLSETYSAAAADFIVDRLEEKGITQGTIVISQDGVNATNQIFANESFCSRVNDLGTDFKLSDPVYMGADEDFAVDRITSVIQSTPDIVAAYGPTGSVPWFWAPAMQDAGKTDLVVVGIGDDEKSVNLVKDGSITAIICQPMYLEGQKCAEYLYDLFNGEVFNGSEDTWFEELDAPLAYVGGEGDHDINYYSDIIERVDEYFK